MPACPHCGHEAEPGATECPLCGTPLPGGGRDAQRAGREGSGERGAGAAGPGREAGAAGGEPVPWEDPRTGFLEGFLATWRESLFDPATLFGRVRDRGSIARALLYFLLVTVVGAFFTLTWQAVWISVLEIGAYARAGDATAVGPVLSFFMSPFLALVGFVMATVIYHVAALVVAPDRRGMGATARVICYAAGPSLLGVVPLVGVLVGAAWTLVLQVVGLREVHRTGTGRALVMVFWLPASLVLLAVVLLVVAAAVGSGGGGGELAVEATGASWPWPVAAVLP